MPTIWNEIIGAHIVPVEILGAHIVPVEMTPAVTAFNPITPAVTNFVGITPANTVFNAINPSATTFWQINPAKFALIKGNHLLSHSSGNYILINNNNFETAMKIKVMTPNNANKIWTMGNFTDCEIVCKATDPLGNNYYATYANSGTNIVKYEVAIPNTVADDIWTYELQVKGSKVKINGLHIILTGNSIGGWVAITPSKTTFIQINPANTSWTAIDPIVTVWTPILPSLTVWGGVP